METRLVSLFYVLRATSGEFCIQLVQGSDGSHAVEEWLRVYEREDAGILGPSESAIPSKKGGIVLD